MCLQGKQEGRGATRGGGDRIMCAVGLLVLGAFTTQTKLTNQHEGMLFEKNRVRSKVCLVNGSDRSGVFIIDAKPNLGNRPSPRLSRSVVTLFFAVQTASAAAAVAIDHTRQTWGPLPPLTHSLSPRHYRR